MIIKMKDGSSISEEIKVADAHPAGKRSFGRAQYIEKFRTLTEGITPTKESKKLTIF